MAKLLVFFQLLLTVSITVIEARASVCPVVIEGVEGYLINYESNSPTSKTLDVFENGKFSTHIHNFSKCEKKECNATEPPRDLKIIAPLEAGSSKFPVVLFNHGTSLLNEFYLDLLSHISSHGYIVVAPQYYYLIPIDGYDELDWANKVANWIPSGLETILPGTWDQQNIALAGHSRGGLIAFAMALGKSKYTTLQVKVSAVIGVDPVAGVTSYIPIKPYILNHKPESFNLSIPVTVIGSGKGGWCTPRRMNHAEFFAESRAPSTHFVVKKYGHIDVLNDKLTGIQGVVACITCGGNHGPRKYMRNTVGGIAVAFLEAYFGGNFEDLAAIVSDPSVAPAAIDEPQVRGELGGVGVTEEIRETT